MRLTTASVLGWVTLVCFTSVAMAVPAAPVVTVGADIKQLQFDWDQVPTSNVYELWFKANDGAPWIKYTEIPAAQTARIRINVSIHLLDWRVAKYRVAACNPSGCTNSAEVLVPDLAGDAIGFVKPQATTGQGFGGAVAMSADGQTFAVVNGEMFGSAPLSATVSVYRKTLGTSINSGWRREARLLPSTVQANTSPGAQLALSGDGNVLALGLFHEALRSRTPQHDAGAVYIFRREGSTWHQEQKLIGNVRTNNGFGILLDIDDPGTTLVVGRRLSNAGLLQMGTVDIYLHGDGGWQRTNIVPPDHGDLGSDQCRGIALSGDGSTLVRTCHRFDASSVKEPAALEIYQIENGQAVIHGVGSVELETVDDPVDVNGDGNRIVVRVSSTLAQIWDRNGLFFFKDGDLPLGEFGAVQNDIAISRDGKLVAAASSDNSPLTGPIYPPVTNGAELSDSVYVFERKGTGWTLRRALKPATSVSTNSFGRSLALGDNGRILAVGSPDDASAATGIGGDPTDMSAPDRGAAWLY